MLKKPKKSRRNVTTSQQIRAVQSEGSPSGDLYGHQPTHLDVLEKARFGHGKSTPDEINKVDDEESDAFL